MRRAAAAALLATLAACTSGGRPHARPSAATAPAREVGPSAAAEMAKLCRRPHVHVPTARASKHVPPVIARTEREVEAVRGLRFRHPVAVAPVTRGRLVAGLKQELAHSFPPAQIRRRGLAWQAIGAIPRGTDLAEVFRRYLGVEVLGYYDPGSKQLVFIGSARPTPVERFVLAHELTHALDDQHFDLSRVNGIENGCRDEELQAATGAIEGSAVHFSVQVVLHDFTRAEQRSVVQASGAVPRGIPQFIVNLETWPYVDGPRFIAALQARGGIAAVNEAIHHPPVSTEQVIHPGDYPSDVPATVDIPELGPKLGKGWRDLDVEEVGEEWLRDLLGLRLDPTEAGPAAAGWDGGLYRAWTDGPRVAVLLRTQWDSVPDATDFVRAMTDWIEPGQFADATPRGTRVDVVFGSDRASFARLQTLEVTTTGGP